MAREPIPDPGPAIPGGPNARPREEPVIRRALGLSQDEFARRFRIPLGTLRDWEQGRKEPDGTARADLVVIASCPEAVAAALARRAA